MILKASIHYILWGEVEIGKELGASSQQFLIVIEC
jgi:hypothetical protein